MYFFHIKDTDLKFSLNNDMWRSECTGMRGVRCEGCAAEMMELLEDPHPEEGNLEAELVPIL